MRRSIGIFLAVLLLLGCSACSYTMGNGKTTEKKTSTTVTDKVDETKDDVETEVKDAGETVKNEADSKPDPDDGRVTDTDGILEKDTAPETTPVPDTGSPTQGVTPAERPARRGVRDR